MRETRSTDPQQNQSIKAKQHVAQVHAPRETERQLNIFLLPFGKEYARPGRVCLPAYRFPPSTHH